MLRDLLCQYILTEVLFQMSAESFINKKYISLLLFIAILCSIVNVGLIKSSDFKAVTRGGMLSVVDEEDIVSLEAAAPENVQKSVRERIGSDSTAVTSGLCVTRSGKNICDIVCIMLVLAELLFAFTGAFFLLFSNDRITRFCQISYIHRSDGKKSNMFIFA